VDLAVADWNANKVSILIHLTVDDPDPTLLQSYMCFYNGEGIEISWTLSEAGTFMDFTVSREQDEAGKFLPIGAEVIRSGRLSFRLVDKNCEPGASYRYRVDVSDEDGTRTLFVTGKTTIEAQELALRQNHPNPFNPTTTISFTLPGRASTTVSIYNIEGRLVVTLVDEILDVGFKEVTWDGRDARSNHVSSGVYFYRLTAGNRTLTKKMVLLH
jgi:hypothetical protein